MRLDSALFSLGLFPSRQKAKEAVLEQKVRYKGQILSKPALEVTIEADSENIDEKPQAIFPKDLQIIDSLVGRAGYKLRAFLDEGILTQAGLSLKGASVLDIGSSTGGFAQVLLQEGAKSITCVDVGSNQLHKSLRESEKITLYENCDVREFAKMPSQKSAYYDLLTCDVSFISLFCILDSLLSFDCPYWLLLFKPQFEVGKLAKRNKKGVVIDEKLIQNALENFCVHLAKTHLLSIHKSQISGKEGNNEIFIFAKRA
ncbi:TlyA family RNA methyltransferase [Helicobacter himalayensis]|uniref:TlyA family RNA methyltransferase n=1 Tax=Helicobacter himalayensis TaxID=1591088 RepID=UPI0008305386|nr:TlyA family RNA methyltransferase [Helicobacter himalayensis]